MNRWGRRRQVLLVIAATLATACSASVEVIGTTTSTSVVATSSTTSSVVDLSDLVGDWDNGQLFLQVADDGSYQVLETPTSDPNDPLMSGFVARDGINVIFVTNIYGECSGQTGVYQALMTEGQLVLTLVDDPCQFRATRFVSPWETSG
jgi:hypothetical protein